MIRVGHRGYRETCCIDYIVNHELFSLYGSGLRLVHHVFRPMKFYRTMHRYPVELITY
jgi:hypothetical protein